MPARLAGTDVFVVELARTRMAGTSPAMTPQFQLQNQRAL
jgi:hypothetical protein